MSVKRAKPKGSQGSLSRYSSQLHELGVHWETLSQTVRWGWVVGSFTDGMLPVHAWKHGFGSSAPMLEQGTVALSCNPSAGRQGQVDPRNSLAASRAELGNPGVSKRLYFNKKCRERESYSRLTSGFHMHVLILAYLHTFVHTHATHTQTHTCTFLLKIISLSK